MTTFVQDARLDGLAVRDFLVDPRDTDPVSPGEGQLWFNTVFDQLRTVIQGDIVALATQWQPGEETNTIIGNGAGASLTSGVGNFGLGKDALASITTHGDNTAIGNNAFEFGVGDDNVFIGSQCGRDGDTDNSVGIGAQAARAKTGGINFVAIGASSATASGSSQGFTAVGRLAENSNTGDYTSSFGYSANRNGSGDYTCALGAFALENAGAALRLIGIGGFAARNSTGDNGFYGGYFAGGDVGAALGGIGIGYQASRYKVGDYGVSVGNHAGKDSTGGFTVAVGGFAHEQGGAAVRVFAGGYQAGRFATGDDGNYVGYQSGYNATGNGNLFMGYRSGYEITSGSSNTIIGAIDGTGYETSSGVLLIGAGTTKLIEFDGANHYRYGLATSDPSSDGAEYVDADGIVRVSGTGNGGITLPAGSVGTSQLAADAVTGAEVADNTLTADHFSGTWGTAYLDTGAVTTPILGNLAVTAAKLAADSVTRSKILEGGGLTNTRLGVHFPGTANDGLTFSYTLTGQTFETNFTLHRKAQVQAMVLGGATAGQPNVFISGDTDLVLRNGSTVLATITDGADDLSGPNRYEIDWSSTGATVVRDGVTIGTPTWSSVTWSTSSFTWFVGFGSGGADPLNGVLSDVAIVDSTGTDNDLLFTFDGDFANTGTNESITTPTLYGDLWHVLIQSTSPPAAPVRSFPQEWLAGRTKDTGSVFIGDYDIGSTYDAKTGILLLSAGGSKRLEYDAHYYLHGLDTSDPSKADALYVDANGFVKVSGVGGG